MNLLATTLAQSSSSSSDAGSAIGAIGALMMCAIYIVLIVLVVAGIWKTFDKAGQPGWAAIVPFYNMYVLCQIAGRPWWWLLLMFIPIVGLVVAIIIAIDVAKSFGKGTGFGIGLALLPFVFYPMLGFGSAQYQGPAAAGAH